MDYFIIILLGCSFFLYIILQPVVFRLIHPDHALLWLCKLFFIVEGSALIAGYMVWNNSQYEVIAIMHGILFALLVVLYILGVFSYAEASLTTKIFIDIEQAKPFGLSRSQLQKRYGIRPIVMRRLERFVATGDVKKIGSTYVWQTRCSLFLLRETGVYWFTKIFPHERTL
jgi:hypothetical protein